MIDEINRPRNEELFNNLKKQYEEIAKFVTECEQIEEMAKELCDIECQGMKCDTCDGYGCEYRMQAEALYNAGYRKQSEWISVDERLPEILQEVLCYRGNFKGDMMNTYTYLGQEMWKDDYGINYSTEEDGITHWMPLPEPPKMKDGAE